MGGARIVRARAAFHFGLAARQLRAGRAQARAEIAASSAEGELGQAALGRKGDLGRRLCVRAALLLGAAGVCPVRGRGEGPDRQGRGAGQGELRALPRHRQGGRQPASGSAALPHALQQIPGRGSRRIARRGHRLGPSRHADLRVQRRTTSRRSSTICSRSRSSRRRQRRNPTRASRRRLPATSASRGRPRPRRARNARPRTS